MLWNIFELRKNAGFCKKTPFCVSEIVEANGTENDTSKLTLNKSCFLRSNKDCIFGMIKGRWYRILLYGGRLKLLIFCGAYCIKAPKIQWKETYGENFFVPWVSFFFSLLCLLKTHEEVWQSLRSRSLFKSACQPGRRKTLCVRDSICHKNAIVSRPPNKDRHIKLTKTLLKHTLSAVMLGGLSFMPCRSLKVHSFTV